MPEFAGDHRLKEAALAHSAAFLGDGPRAEQIGAESTKRRRVLAQRCAVLPVLRPDGGPFLVRTFLHSVRVQGGGSTPRPRAAPNRAARPP